MTVNLNSEFGRTLVRVAERVLYKLERHVYPALFRPTKMSHVVATRYGDPGVEMVTIHCEDLHDAQELESYLEHVAKRDNLKLHVFCFPNANANTYTLSTGFHNLIKEAADINHTSPDTLFILLTNNYIYLGNSYNFTRYRHRRLSKVFPATMLAHICPMTSLFNHNVEEYAELLVSWAVRKYDTEQLQELLENLCPAQQELGQEIKTRLDQLTKVEWVEVKLNYEGN